MKRLLIFSLFSGVLVLSACNGNGGNKANDTGNNEDKRKAMLEANRHVQMAIETGNMDTLRKYIAADAVDHGGGPNGADVKGEDLFNQLASAHNNISNLKMETLQDAANDEYIFALVRTTGTTIKPMWGMPANYKMDSRNVDVIKVKDMKMVDHWSYADPVEMMKMMQQGAPGSGNNNPGKMMKDSAR